MKSSYQIMRLIPCVLALVLFSGATRLVLGRNIDITWTLGENYAPIDAAIGDTLVRFMIRDCIILAWFAMDDETRFR